jgi:hypothetical protein
MDGTEVNHTDGDRRSPDCSDVVNTYRVWLRYELFEAAVRHCIQASEASELSKREQHKPHLAELTELIPPEAIRKKARIDGR